MRVRRKSPPDRVRELAGTPTEGFFPAGGMPGGGFLFRLISAPRASGACRPAPCGRRGRVVAAPRRNPQPERRARRQLPGELPAMRLNAREKAASFS